MRLLMVMVLASLASTTCLAQDNLVPSGDFESGLVEGWLTDVIVGPVEFTVTEENVHGGGKALEMKAEAAGLSGVSEVRFYVRQGGIFERERLLGSARKPPYHWTWRFRRTDRGRYAELWAKAVGPGDTTRDSTHALVMVKP